MLVKLWMGTDVVTVGPEQTIAEAKKLMHDRRIRRLPVVEGQALVGVVSQHDLKKVMPSILDAQGESEAQFVAENTEIRTVMTPSPITIGPDDTLVEAARKMRRNKIDGLPVVENRKLVGILSISDILDAFLEIMVVDRPGTRFDLKIDQAPETFYKMIRSFQKQQKEIVAMTQFSNFSKDQQMISIQILGDDNGELIDMLWANNVTVDRITPVS